MKRDSGKRLQANFKTGALNRSAIPPQLPRIRKLWRLRFSAFAVAASTLLLGERSEEGSGRRAKIAKTRTESVTFLPRSRHNRLIAH